VEISIFHTGPGFTCKEYKRSHVINFRGVTPVYLPAIWKLSIPPRIHFFLWLVSKNKLLTRDNLGKRRKVDDPSCLFYSEKESIPHLFFECVLTKKVNTCFLNAY
jgi:hypothetical protein